MKSFAEKKKLLEVTAHPPNRVLAYSLKSVPDVSNLSRILLPAWDSSSYKERAKEAKYDPANIKSSYERINEKSRIRLFKERIDSSLIFFDHSCVVAPYLKDKCGHFSPVAVFSSEDKGGYYTIAEKYFDELWEKSIPFDQYGI